MSDHTIQEFVSGVQNILPNEIIANDAAQDEQNWLTRDGRLKLAYGRQLLGQSGGAGQIGGLWIGYKNDGSKVYYRKRTTTVQYLNGSTWTDILTGLTANSDYSFSNYASLAGSFTFIVGPDGIWKINNANPASVLNMTSATQNFATGGGLALIDNARMILWNRPLDKTGLYFSYTDQLNYTTIPSEILGSSGSTAYSGTLGFKAIDPIANCFALEVIAPIGTPKTISNIALTSAPSGSFTTVTATAHGFNLGDTVLITGLTQNPTGTGTISGSGQSITGVGTAFTTQLKVGGKITFNDTAGLNTFVILSIADDTHLQLTTNCSGGSGVTFTYSSPYELVSIPFKVITVVDANNVNIAVNSYTYPPYNSGGDITKCDVLTEQGMGLLMSNTTTSSGTINYVTGAYAVTLANSATENVVAAYQSEDSNSKGVTDFTFSGERTGGQGNYISQAIGGDAILNVLLGQPDAIGNTAYYSIKSTSALVTSISADDVTFTSTVYRKDIGIPSYRSGVSTANGIIFVNTANISKPQLTILKRNPIGDNIEPEILFPNFQFLNYTFDDCEVSTWDKYITILCKSANATENDTLLLGDLTNTKGGSVDIFNYQGRVSVKDNLGNLYLGSPFSENVYQIFSGFDDLGNPIDNYWIGKEDQYMMALGLSRLKRYQIGELLKKFRKLKIKGKMDKDQVVEVWIDYDGSGNFEQIGTILGSASYVDYSDPQTVGANMIGGADAGGNPDANAYPYFAQFKVNPPKFRARTIKLIATGIGYFDVEYMSDWNLELFEQRMPVRFRQKQNVSIDGTVTDMPSIPLYPCKIWDKSHVNTDLGEGANLPIAQPFFCNIASILTSAAFWINVTNPIQGTVVAKIYTMTGQFGNNISPNPNTALPGTLLATSDSIDLTTLSTTAGLVNFTFSGANQLNLISGNYYVVSVEMNSITITFASVLDSFLNTIDPTFGNDHLTFSGFGTGYPALTMGSTLQMIAGYQTAFGFTARNGEVLTNAQTYLYVNSTAPRLGNLYLKIYGISGTYGSDAVPSGPLLATSDPLPASQIASTIPGAMANFTFSGANQINLESTEYFAVLYSDIGDYDYGVIAPQSAYAPSGRQSAYYDTGTSAWVADATTVYFFSVNGNLTTAGSVNIWEDDLEPEYGCYRAVELGGVWGIPDAGNLVFYLYRAI